MNEKCGSCGQDLDLSDQVATLLTKTTAIEGFLETLVKGFEQFKDSPMLKMLMPTAKKG